MEKEMICISCPIGCMLKVSDENGNLSVSGNSCKRGIVYAENEITNPLRTLTTTMPVEGCDKIVAVRSSAPVSKHKINEIIKLIKESRAKLPVYPGKVLIENVDSGANIIATDSL